VAIGARKYQRGRRQRAAGVQWVQTMLEVEEHEGHRKAKRLRACLVDDRTAEPLVGNIKANVVPSTPVQTDGWASYRRLQDEGFPHGSVNHSASEWACRRPCGTVGGAGFVILFLIQ